MLAVVLVVDVANVMGARPDGWWRDRAGAATRLLTDLEPFVGQRVPLGADASEVIVTRVVGIVEGAARAAGQADGAQVEVVRADGSGDDAIVTVADAVHAAGRTALVVTADRGLRARLPAGALVSGPRSLLALLPG